MKNNHGGKRPGAGRKPGKMGEAKRALSEIAKEYAEEAVSVLATAMREADTWQARIAAADKLLDRGYGKAPQPQEHKGSVSVTISTKDASVL